MKFSRRTTIKRYSKIPDLKFEDQQLTSFAGLVVFQQLFRNLRLKERLHRCFSSLECAEIYRPHVIMLLLIVHLLIGHRRLRDIDYYHDDPMVKRLLGVERLPSVPTISRVLRSTNAETVSKVRDLGAEVVLERLSEEKLSRVTMDFDGSVQSTTGRNIEGTAVGFNKKKKGQRSYYPLFCTIAQSAQILDVLHRPGNVHDSNGAHQFIVDCIARVRQYLPEATIEQRMDSAFFSDEIISELESMNVEYSVSVPFERFPELKQYIEGRKKWRRLDETWSFFEMSWKPKSWDKNRRFLFLRKKCRQVRKGPVQLDLFVPYEYGYEFKVIITNKQISARKVLAYHNGRGSQEKIFGEAKSQAQLDYIAVKRLYGNQTYLLAATLAYNLNRELQMATKPRERGTTAKRMTLWAFQELETIRRNLIQRAGRLTSPQGTLTLTLSANRSVRTELLNLLDCLTGVA